MDKTDREAIEGLFDRLARVERETPGRDAEAERFIADAIRGQPGAPYYMAQTVIVQEHALNAAQARIEQLEAELADARTSPQGGFLSGAFRRRQRAPTPRTGAAADAARGAGRVSRRGRTDRDGGSRAACFWRMPWRACSGARPRRPKPRTTPSTDTDADLGDAGFDDFGL